MLKIKNLYTAYGRILVLKNVSLHVDRGEIVCLIGANGAGKTTLLLTVSGLVSAREGEIFFEGVPIHHLAPHQIVRLGISQVPEGRQIFAPLTVRENLELGAYHRWRQEGKRAVLADLEEVYRLFPRLKEREKQLAGTLSGGEQQMLAIGRAFMARPKLLLLDEPSLGLAPKLVDFIMEKILELNRQGLTILIVEQNARRALEIAHRGYVLETGRIVLQGSAQELALDEDVRRAYLGRDYKEFAEV
ncbi:ABC transporter ATP-binding protein [Thermosulfuriphilus ammonigenes]|uniref:ABC transporter ATP-binding protein n=1 Tax=Thermosulfuriphilus ammonigenes TaxID=1936021 RepID=A0A6G7PTL2_9BACT|nr:ABC transporter ATP-binding protein [Thermosulfuriphilus ammonigenes]MBA2848889.1 branched-chain amino acid transport system ATP-binding protein [Thermosulfuriphilus ammonigenes]QIJ70992.1 ABC transporter ATP-binding protein [Thermosulfuriphilus ammonigenes]HFB83276.1 ABC transporter ATP-binding protein [Thermodesulfatator sp.]